MRWKAKPKDQWRNRFAFLPIRIGDEVIWWERYQSRDAGLYTEVRQLQEWPNCCDQLVAEAWFDGLHQPEHCPVHTPRLTHALEERRKVLAENECTCVFRHDGRYRVCPVCETQEQRSDERAAIADWVREEAEHYYAPGARNALVRVASAISRGDHLSQPSNGGGE